MVTPRFIQAPSWARPIAVSISRDFEQLDYDDIQRLRPTVENAAATALESYLNELNENSIFPEIGKLTGQYYLSAESYDVVYEPWFPKVGRSREVRFAFLYHFLEHPLNQLAIDQDYLGLEVHFKWNRQLNSITWAATDSSSI